MARCKVNKEKTRKNQPSMLFNKVAIDSFPFFPHCHVPLSQRLQNIICLVIKKKKHVVVARESRQVLLPPRCRINADWFSPAFICSQVLLIAIPFPPLLLLFLRQQDFCLAEFPQFFLVSHFHHLQKAPGKTKAPPRSCFGCAKNLSISSF